MDKNCFDKLLDNPTAFTPDNWTQLRQERDRFPFSAPLQVLSLLADKASGAPLWEQQAMPRVALFFKDKDCLNNQLSSPSWMPKTESPGTSPASAPIHPPEPDIAIELESDQPYVEPIVDNDGPFDILKEINDYQEVSFKTAPKSVILTNFLEKDGGIRLEISNEEEIPIQELAKKSIQSNNSLETETLALILERQGKLEQALAMYEKLLANNPKKSSIFAVRIAELKSRINEIN